MARDVGYPFVVALSDAIERATAAFAREDPTAFRYRGADLRHAVERALYVALVNNASLYEAYRDQRAPAEIDGLGSALERAVARSLLMPEQSAGSGRPVLRRLGARALWHAWARGDGHAAPAFAASGPLAFVLDHAKYLPFLDPVRQRLGAGDELVVSLVPELTRAAERAGADHVALDTAAGRPARGRAVGVGLLGALPLLGLFDALLDVLEARRPRCVTVVEGMSPGDELANRAARQLGIPTLCLQQGWSPFVHAGFRNMSYGAMAVWGQGFADLLAPSNPRQRFVAAGSFTLAAEVDTGRAELAATLTGRRAVAFFLQPRSPLIRSEHQEALLDLVARTAGRLSDRAVLVREHPGAPLATGEREALLAGGALLAEPGRFSLRAVLEVARTAVSIYSTSLVEAAAMGCVPIVFNPTSMPRYSPDLEALGAGVEARTVEEAEEAVVRLTEDEPARTELRPGLEGFRAAFFGGSASPADEVVGLLDELVAARG
jgi:hypothetical protein